MPTGTWEVLPLRPPSQLKAESFDLAFGVSVFTHLKETEQFAWLQELQRVIRPGGLALMTFHGDASVLWSGLSAERFTALKRRGICDQANPLYDAELGEDDYYRDVFHTTEYIRREWGKYFVLLAIKPCSVAHPGFGGDAPEVNNSIQSPPMIIGGLSWAFCQNYFSSICASDANFFPST